MTILRLKGLNVQAGLEDIRKFFKCLYIPDGGVWIVGGSLGEAFIAFTTEKDAQRAMRYSGKALKGSKVILRISSMGELEHKLKQRMKRKAKEKEKDNHIAGHSVKTPEPRPHPRLSLLKTSFSDPKPAYSPSSEPRLRDPRIKNLTEPASPDATNVSTSDVNSLDPSTAFLLGICTVLQGLQTKHENGSSQAENNFPTNESPSGTYETVMKAEDLCQNTQPGYVRLFGLPASTTKEDICQFFRSMTVQEVILNVKLGLKYGCLVKFANTQDAHDALYFNGRLLGLACVEVRAATEKLWTSVLQECDNAFHHEGNKEKYSKTCQDIENDKLMSTSPLHIESSSFKRLPHSPRKTKSLLTSKYVVMARNLPKNMTKTEIKELFACPDIAHNNIQILLDKKGNRTDTAFLIFNCIEDYEYAIDLSGCHVGSGTIQVSSVTEEKMRNMMT